MTKKSVQFDILFYRIYNLSMTETLAQYLSDLGFSHIEALVYQVLVTDGQLSGYQIAKKLNRTRPSIYGALDNLVAKHFINLVPGKTARYSAVDPESLIDEISNRVKNSANSAKLALKELSIFTDRNRFENIEGKSNLISTALRIIRNAKKEILINSSMDLKPFEKELKLAAKRKVRIILFSWENIDTYDIPLEFYCGYEEGGACIEERFFLVADLQNCIAGSNDKSTFFPHMKAGKKLPAGERDFFAMSTSNRLFVNMVTEHIHFDIYLHRLKKKSNQEVITRDIQIGTLMEKGL